MENGMDTEVGYGFRLGNGLQRDLANRYGKYPMTST